MINTIYILIIINNSRIYFQILYTFHLLLRKIIFYHKLKQIYKLIHHF